MSATLLGQSILSGIFAGSLYALLGLGMSLSWRYLRVINLAHFAFVFFAAYLTYEFAGVRGVNPLVVALVLVPLFFLFGVMQQALILRFNVNEFSSVIVTYGLAIVAEALIQLIWSADYVRYENRAMHGNLALGTLLFPVADLVMAGIAIGLCFAVWAGLHFTWLGKALRAGLDNPQIAASFGVPNQRLLLLVAGTAGALAAIGGFFVAVLYTLAPSQIFSWLGVVFAAVLLGGLGNPIGLVAASLLIGVSEAITMAITAPSWAPVVPFTILILLLVLWPERV
jgi:branched-chain amino acid transport system permease protein